MFGNAVNHKLGHLGYGFLYYASGRAAWGAHAAVTDLPVARASGAIHGVRGAFRVFFPRNDVKVLLRIALSGTVVTVSSMWALLFYAAWDVLFLVLQSAGKAALWAHVAGFFLGFTVSLACVWLGFVRANQDEQTLLDGFRGRR